MSNLAKNVEYEFIDNLTFSNMCKIVAYFSKEFTPSYFSFHSEVIKRDGYANNFNVTLKNNQDESVITINVSSICFHNIDVKDALTKYEEVIKVIS